MSRESVEGEIRGACARICEQLDGIAEEWGTAAELRAERDELERRADFHKAQRDEVRAERDDLEAQVTSLLGVIDERDDRIANLSRTAERQEERRDEAREERDTLADRLLFITAALDDRDAPDADTPVQRIELWAAEWQTELLTENTDLRKRLAEQQRRADRHLLDRDKAAKQAHRLTVARDDETGRADAAELEVSELQRVNQANATVYSREAAKLRAQVKELQADDDEKARDAEHVVTMLADESARAAVLQLRCDAATELRRGLEADNRRLDIELADCRAKNDELSGWLANPDSRDADRATDWAVGYKPPGAAITCSTFIRGATATEARAMAANNPDYTNVKIYRLHSRLVSESRSGWVDA